MTAPINPIDYLTGILRFEPSTLASMEGLLTKIPTRNLELNLTRNAIHLQQQVAELDERTQP